MKRQQLLIIQHWIAVVGIFVIVILLGNGVLLAVLFSVEVLIVASWEIRSIYRKRKFRRVIEEARVLAEQLEIQDSVWQDLANPDHTHSFLLQEIQAGKQPTHYERVLAFGIAHICLTGH